MITVILYYREKNQEFEQLLSDLQALQAVVPHQLVTMDVTRERDLRERFGSTRLPILQAGNFHLQPPFTRQDLQIMLSAARDRMDQLERIDQAGLQQRLEKGRTLSSGDRLSNWLSRHYLALANLFLLLYTGLAFLAPVFMKTGHPIAATVLYRMYGTMCHQLAFRSWFMFGAQPFYPREMAGLSGVTSYESLKNSPEVDLLAARDFVGDEAAGYKVALCERDIAIYGFMLLFGLMFAVLGRRLRSVPWYVWVTVGLAPITLDGVSQLFGMVPFLARLITARESTPLLRTLTGGLFGWMTAWYLFPMLEETARETRHIIRRKMAVIQQAERARES
jgi:uncharacterized membrane protein